MYRCLLVLLMALAAFLRLYRLDLANVTGDEGVHGLFAMNIARLLDFPLAGLPSVGIRNSALFLYVLALPYLIVSQPLAGVVFIAALNVLVGWPLYRLTFRLAGKGTALVALALWAAAPWQVLYSRQMWPPSLLALVCLVVIAVAIAWLQSGDRRRLVFLVVAAFLVPQLHFSGFCATVWLAAVIAVRYRQVRPLPLLAGLAIGLATWTPWLWFQAASGYADLRNLTNAGQGKEPFLATAGAATGWWLTLGQAGGLDFWFRPEPEVQAEYLGTTWPRAADIMGLVWSATMLIAVGASLLQRDLIQRLLGFWCLLPIAMLLVLRPKMHPHYPLIAYPIPFVLVAIWMRRLVCRSADSADTGAGSPRRRTWLVTVGSLFVILMLVTHLVVLADWFRYVRDDRLTGRGFYQLSFRQRQAVVESILADCPDRVVDLAGMFSGLNPGYYWIYNYEQIRRGYMRYPRDEGRRYWIDELGGDAAPPVPGTVIEKHWRVGPARVFRMRQEAVRQP